MTVGAEPKKVGTLAVLLAAAAGIFYYQFANSPPAPSAAAPTRTAPQAARPARLSGDQLVESGAARPRTAPRNTADFKPTLKRTKPGEALDPSKVDPTLRLDLLAKVQGVDYNGVERNLFLFGAAKPKVTTPPPEAAKPEGPKPAAAAKPAGAEAPGAAPSKPPPPPINLKYFGFANRPGDGRKRAFFLDGEDILVAAEGEVVKKRYKIVRIGINSVVIEDLDFKNQQTLPLQEG